MATIPPKIQIEDLSLQFGPKRLFEQFSLTVRAGEKILLAGPSGSGKSSILASIAGFLKPERGTIRIDGDVLTPATVWNLRRQFTYVPQQVDFGEGTVQSWMNEMLTFRNNDSISSTEGMPRELSALGLDKAILAQQSSDISGGERQRVALAFALFLNRPLLLLDEPSSALDATSAQALFHRLAEITDMTMLLVSHEHPERLPFVNRIVKLGE